MTYDNLRTRFAVYLGAEDTTIDVLISTTDRDALINEAYIEYMAMYDPIVINALNINPGAVAQFLVGSTLSSQIKEISAMGVEIVPASLIYTPMVHSTYTSVLKLHQTEGATGVPQVWGSGSFQYNQVSISVGQVGVAVYPFPSAAYVYDAFLSVFPPDLSTGASTVPIDDQHCDYIARIAAYRAGYTLGYDDLFLSEMISPLPDAVAQNMALDHANRFSSVPMGSAQKLGEDRRAV